jgi:hypothetical protein
VCFYLFEGFKRYLVPIPGDGVLQVDLVKVLHFGFINIVRTPMGPDEQETFGSQMFVDASINGGAIQRISLQGSVTTLVLGKVGNVTGTFNTEMTALTMTGSSSLGTITFRESPTLPSVGQTSITSIGGGAFQINSFFDVFAELQVGNSPFVLPQSDGGPPSERVALTNPEPGTLSLFGVCTVGFLFFGLCRRTTRLSRLRSSQVSLESPSPSAMS